MMFIKVTPLFLLALFIDAMQFLLALGFSAAMAIPGTIGGATLGGVGGQFLCSGFGSAVENICSTIGAGVFGLIGSAPFINGPIAAVTEPIGIALGFAISVCLSFTFGSMLVFFLFLFGLLDKKAAMFTYIGEALPGFGMLPAWSALVARCAYVSYKEAARGKVVGGLITTSQSFVLPESPIGEAMGKGTDIGITRAFAAGEFTEQEEKQEIPERKSPAMQDIKLRPLSAANDNAPRAVNDNLIGRERYAA
jgi:hypothetical protein